MAVKISRLLLGNDHDDAKWLVLVACVEGAPEACQVRRAINTAALVSGDEMLEQHRAELTAIAEEYHGRYLAVQEALKEL